MGFQRDRVHRVHARRHRMGLISFIIFGDDPHTRSILIYMESVGDARSFLAAAREIALAKPIIVIKTGTL